MRSGSHPQRGFSYLLLLLLVALAGFGSATLVELGADYSRKGAEERLLMVGGEFSRALESYRAATPGGAMANRNPKELEDLLKDPRYPNVKRHLRQIYPDPLSGNPTWGILRAADGTVAAIYSQADGTPIKRTGFPLNMAGFENAQSYATWQFGTPTVGMVAPATHIPADGGSPGATQTPK